MSLTALLSRERSVFQLLSLENSCAYEIIVVVLLRELQLVHLSIDYIFLQKAAFPQLCACFDCQNT